MRWLQDVGKWIAMIAGVIAILLGILHIFSIVDLDWFKTRVPLLIVVLAGLILELLIAMSYRQESHSRLLERQLEHDTLIQLANMRGKVDSRLQHLVGGEVEHIFGQVKSALADNTLQLNNIEKFRGFFVKTLEVYPGKEFWATSVPSRKYFWRNDEVEVRMETFIRGGGTIKRIFFLNSEEELRGEEAQDILNRQKQVGVQVYYAMVEDISSELLRFFVVESHGEVAWETFRGPDSAIRSVKVITGPEHTSDYIHDFTELLRLPCVRRY